MISNESWHHSLWVYPRGRGRVLGKSLTQAGVGQRPCKLHYNLCHWHSEHVHTQLTVCISTGHIIFYKLYYYFFQVYTKHWTCGTLLTAPSTNNCKEIAQNNKLFEVPELWQRNPPCLLVIFLWMLRGYLFVHTLRSFMNDVVVRITSSISFVRIAFFNQNNTGTCGRPRFVSRTWTFLTQFEADIHTPPRNEKKSQSETAGNLPHRANVLKRFAIGIARPTCIYIKKSLDCSLCSCVSRC